MADLTLGELILEAELAKGESRASAFSGDAEGVGSIACDVNPATPRRLMEQVHALIRLE